MNLQQFFAMSFGLSVENLYYIAIAVLACVLGAEIAGICMLVGKMRRAKSRNTDASNDEYNNGGGANYALAALSFGAVSATAELALLVLAIAAAVGAFVLCVLLIALRAKGYLLISAKDERAAEEQKAATPAYAPVEVPEPAPVKEEAPTPAPEPDYVEPYQDDVAAQKAIANLINTEDAVLAEEAPVEEAPAEEVPVEEEVAETVEVAEEVPAEEPAEAVTETAVTAAPAAVAPAQPIQQTFMPQGMPAYAGQGPFVEKHIIETTKEIIKETNTTTVTEDKTTNPVTEEMMKAIDALKQLEAQIRMEREIAVARPVQENGEGTPAPIDAEDEELEIEEIEEIETEDEVDAEDEAEREADAEENDDEYESDLFGNERIVGFDEETGCYIIARYRKSCEAKLMQSRPATKKYYSAIRNALMGYEGTKERMSWTIDTYTNEHTQIAKINVRPRTLDLYLALEPSTLEDSVYRGRDVGSKKKYAETPFLYKVNSPRKLTLALELVQRACEEQGLSPIDIEEINYEEQYPFTDTETLIARGLIREYLREEKPAVTFELDPDHVPQLIEEDETVIPANANFTWEFDNDQPEPEPEPEPVEEPAPEEPVEEPVIVEEPEEEPVIVEEPTVEETPVTTTVSGTTTTTTTTHETIRTTERHYTEHYYGTGAAAQISEETRTVELIPEHIAAPIEAEAEEIAPETAEEPVTEEVTEEVAPEAAPETEEVTEEVEETVGETVEETEEAEAPAEVQSSVAALFGDDVFEEDEPIEAPAPEVAPEEEAVEDVVEEVAEEVVEETVEEPTPEVEEPAPEAEEAEEVAEEVEEVVEEVVEEEYYEEEPEEVVEEEYYEEEAEEVVEEEYYEEEPEEVVEEEYYEEEPEETVEEEYYEDVVEEEYYEEEPTEEVEEYYEEVYYEEDPDAVAEEEYYEEEYYEEEPEEVVEEVVEEEEVEEEPAPQPAPTTDVVLLDVCTFDDYFDNGAIINLETLKQVGLAPESATRLKVYASGELKGQFTVEANHFTLDAIKAISDADGDSIMIR